MSAKPEHYDIIRKPVITEKATLAYIRKTFDFTDAAARDFDAAFSKL